MIRSYVIGAAVALLLAGCGGGGDKTAAPTPSASAAALTGTAAFIEFTHSNSFGNVNFATVEDSQVLDIGNTACEGLSSGLGFGRVVQGYVESNAHPTAPEAEAFTRAAVTNLCPEQAGQLP